MIGTKEEMDEINIQHLKIKKEISSSYVSNFYHSYFCQ